MGEKRRMRGRDKAGERTERGKMDGQHQSKRALYWFVKPTFFCTVSAKKIKSVNESLSAGFSQI